jgi:hypothetical protein
MKGVASHDSTLKYGLLRWIIPFRLIAKENFQPFVDNIINEEVRESLNAYFRAERNVLRSGWDPYQTLQANYVRPYLTSKNIIDVDAVFSISRYEINDPNRFLNYEALKAQFDSPEFSQLLFELRVKTAVPIFLISKLLEVNSQLQKTIQLALVK